jgi:hypothetical protein
MASIEELSQALVKADAAGNVEDAKTFANAIRQMRLTPTASPEPRSLGQEVMQKVGVATRGVNEALVPVVAGTMVGGALGGPVGAALGGLAGGLAVPAGDVAMQGYNWLTNSNLRTPSQVISSMIPGPRAETPTERVIQSGFGSLGGTGGAVTAGRALMQAPRVTQGLQAVGAEASRNPIQQLAIAPAATVAGQTATELSGNPLVGLGTSLATGVIASPRAPKRGVVPTTEELAAKSKANYAILDKSKFELDNGQFQQSMGDMSTVLRSVGYDPRTMPKVQVALDNLALNNPKTVQELGTLRTIISNAARSGDAPERLAGSTLLDKFDNYVLNAPASATIVADKAAMQAWKDARADYSKMKKGEIIDNILERADVSQGSKEANIASGLSSLAKNEKQMRFFNKDEQDAIREAAKGGKIQTILRTLGKFSPMTPAATIFTAVNPYGLQTAATGMVAKTIAEQRRVRDVNRLAARMRLGEVPKVIEGPLANTPVFAARGVQNMLSPSEQNQNALAQ